MGSIFSSRPRDRPASIVLSIVLTVFGAVASVCAQAPNWFLAEHLDRPDYSNSADQWTIYGRDVNAGILGLPLTSGDFNGDGFDDVAVTGTRTDTWIVLSDGRGGDLDLQVIDANRPIELVVRIARDLSAPGFAGELSVGDFNSDGLDDLLIGSQTNNSNAGAVYIVWGSTALGGQVIQLGADPPPSLGVTTLLGTTLGSRVGIWVAASDVDGDGIDDVLFSADQTPGGSAIGRPETGSAYVTYGAAAMGPGQLFAGPGVNHLLPLDSLPAGPGLTVLHGVDEGDHFGSTIVGGRLDSNMRSEVIVSAALQRAGASIGGSGVGAADGPRNARDNAGETYIFWDEEFPTRNTTIDLLSAPPRTMTRIIGPRQREYTGEEIVTGDFDGDGRSDLVIGGLVANGSSRGGLWIIYNDGDLMGKTIDLAEVDPSTGVVRVKGARIRTTEMRGAATGDLLGDTVRAIDLNRDGKADLVIGVPGHSNSQIYIFYGASERMPPLLDFSQDPELADPRLDPFHPVRIRQINRGDTIGYSIHFGDFNGDATPDLLVNGMLADGKGGTPEKAGHAYFVNGQALNLLAGVEVDASVAPDRWRSYR